MEEIRPPFVLFENRAIEDRTASIQAGYQVMRDIPFIVIIPHGSEGKTRIEQPYAEWRQKMMGKVGVEHRAPGADNTTPLVSAARFPRAWFDRIEQEFQAWIKGETLEVDGTPLRNWPVISKAQLKNCEGIHLYTVEALAEASDEAISRLGMGGVNLQQQAKAYLSAQKGDAGKLASQISSLEAKVRDLMLQNEQLRQELKAAQTSTEA